MICAGIVLYNPNIELLEKNLKAILPQVSCVIIIDNWSDNFFNTKNRIIELGYNIFFINNKDNKGIAFALNQIMEKGESLGAEWVLTLDQDSISPPNLVKELYGVKNEINSEKQNSIGIICPLIRDKHAGILVERAKERFNIVKSCITSASLTNVKVWRNVGGFDTSMFIDGVDEDYCLTLIEHGYVVLKCNTVELLHELGHNARYFSFLGRKSIIFNHSAFRYYYICRNIIYNNRKHTALRHSPIRGLLTILYRWFLILLFESNKWSKTCAMFKGTIAGFTAIINKI